MFLPNLRGAVVLQMMCCNQAHDWPLLPYCGYRLPIEVCGCPTCSTKLEKTTFKAKWTVLILQIHSRFRLALFKAVFFSFFCLGEHLFEDVRPPESQLLTCAHDTQSLTRKVYHNHSALWFFELSVFRRRAILDCGDASLHLYQSSFRAPKWEI